MLSDLETDAYRQSCGIGEWYGKLFTRLSGAQRREYARAQLEPASNKMAQLCPFRTRHGVEVRCTKDGGVCSLRHYRVREGNQDAAGIAESIRELCTTCPYRFHEDDLVVRWIGETILQESNPLTVAELPFLERTREDGDARPGPQHVGRIDSVLVHRDTSHFRWCALEMQAVYFSGDSMRTEFEYLSEFSGDEIPSPRGRRRPDFRSSGPKRLMPQLQIKVPTLRRWGKKMCVVVDRRFFHAMGPMEEQMDLSNSDIAWFVVTYEEVGEVARLSPDFVRFTTLERAVEGLTAGRPITLTEFEKRLRAKLG
jgi:hypothetical protein